MMMNLLWDDLLLLVYVGLALLLLPLQQQLMSAAADAVVPHSCAKNSAFKWIPITEDWEIACTAYKGRVQLEKNSLIILYGSGFDEPLELTLGVPEANAFFFYNSVKDSDTWSSQCWGEGDNCVHNTLMFDYTVQGGGNDGCRVAVGRDRFSSCVSVVKTTENSTGSSTSRIPVYGKPSSARVSLRDTELTQQHKSGAGKNKEDGETLKLDQQCAVKNTPYQQSVFHHDGVAKTPSPYVLQLRIHEIDDNTVKKPSCLGSLKLRFDPSYQLYVPLNDWGEQED